MLSSLIAVLMIGAGLPVAHGHLEWHKVTRPPDWWYYMPPPECRIGPLPPYTIVLLSQAEMDRKYLTPDSPYEHMFGYADMPSAGSYVVYMSRDLPREVSHDILIHEQAHLRGCDGCEHD